MSEQTIRAQLAAALTPLLPPGKYQVKPGLGVVARLAKPLIQFEQTTIEPNQGAPLAFARVEVKVHVVTHLEGVTDRAEDAIDLLGLEVFETLHRMEWLRPIRAEKGVYRDTHLSYIITTELTTKRS